jgi:hypothetical protein
MQILEIARHLRLECVTEEQVREVLTEISDHPKAAAVARSMVSSLRGDLLEARGIDDFVRIQKDIQDLEFFLWQLEK